jgi:hypothetical protein
MQDRRVFKKAVVFTRGGLEVERFGEKRYRRAAWPALRGWFKGETGEKFHLLPRVVVSKSEIQNTVWFDQVC